MNTKADKILLRGGSLSLITALALAWCLVGLKELDFFKIIFPGELKRVLSAHIDFLIMTALIFGISSTRVEIHKILKWFVVVGAFTNSFVFLIFAMIPSTDPNFAQYDKTSTFNLILAAFIGMSFFITTVGFGGSAITIFKSTFSKKV